MSAATRSSTSASRLRTSASVAVTSARWARGMRRKPLAWPVSRRSAGSRMSAPATSSPSEWWRVTKATATPASSSSSATPMAG